MPSSSSPSSEAEGTLPPGLRQKKSVYEKLALLALLVILTLGYLDVIPFSALRTQEQRRVVRPVSQTTGFTTEDLYVHHIEVRPAQEISEKAAFIQQFRFQEDPTPTRTPSVQRRPALALEPPSLPVRTIVDIPPPPYSLPTATQTRIPTPTPLPTATPPPPPAATSLPTATLMPTAALPAGIKHVVIISIDGLRPDALIAADAPQIDSLIDKGTFCPTAQTSKMSVTLPGHASMLSGMIPEKHGLLWSAPYIGWPGLNGPTLFTVAHEAGFSTAMVVGKEKLNYIAINNSVDKRFAEDTHDSEVKDQAIKFIQEGLTDILFIHFPDTDRVGHSYGWMSTYQLQAITFVDGMIGEIVAELESEGYLSNTLLIITADHGGHDFDHGDDSPVDRTIPWLAVGPGVPEGLTLYRPVNTMDTAATVLYTFDLPIPEKWDGRPVMEIFTLPHFETQ